MQCHWTDTSWPSLSVFDDTRRTLRFCRYIVQLQQVLFNPHLPEIFRWLVCVAIIRYVEIWM